MDIASKAEMWLMNKTGRKLALINSEIGNKRKEIGQKNVEIGVKRSRKLG
jgi:hypothetical protein